MGIQGRAGGLTRRTAPADHSGPALAAVTGDGKPGTVDGLFAKQTEKLRPQSNEVIPE